MIQDAFAGGVSELFLIAGILSVVAIVAVALLREKPLGTATAVELLQETAAEELLDSAEMAAGGSGEELWVEDEADSPTTGTPAKTRAPDLAPVAAPVAAAGTRTHDAPATGKPGRHHGRSFAGRRRAVPSKSTVATGTAPADR